MKTSANIATYKPRVTSGSLKKAIDSLMHQVDIVRVYFNPSHGLANLKHDSEKVFFYTGEDLTDNGKFYHLDYIDEPEYYFCCDDDLIYPHNYVQHTIENIKKFGCIISYHGRILQSAGLDYYWHHQTFRCLEEQQGDILIDVPGTGVTAFDTRYFNPNGLAHHPNKRMSDLVFAHEAMKQGKRIGCCSRSAGWIKHIDNKESIHQTETNTGNKIQNQMADEIFRMKYGK